MFHSARWDHDHDLSGERVAVIGTGASAIQIVPKIQRQVGALHLFQRTPPWVHARRRPPRDRLRARSCSDACRRRSAPCGPASTSLQESTCWGRSSTAGLRPCSSRSPPAPPPAGPGPGAAREADPDYTLGCKRITMSNTYYRALSQPNAEVVTDPIAEVTERGSAPPTAASTSSTRSSGRPASTSSTTPFAAVRGRDGKTLADAWQGSPRAHLGTAVAGFPNLFLLVGPNSAGGYNSIIFSSEAHINYVAAACARWTGPGSPPSRCRPDVYDAFARETERRLGASVWNRGGCASWYLDRTGATGSGGRASRRTSGAAPAASTAAATSLSRRSPSLGPTDLGSPYPGRVHRGRDRAHRRVARHVLAGSRPPRRGSAGGLAPVHGPRHARGRQPRARCPVSRRRQPLLHLGPDLAPSARPRLAALGHRRPGRGRCYTCCGNSRGRHPHAPRLGVGDLSLQPRRLLRRGGRRRDRPRDAPERPRRRRLLPAPRPPRARPGLTAGQVDVRLSQALLDMFVDAGRGDDLRRPEPTADRAGSTWSRRSSTTTTTCTCGSRRPSEARARNDRPGHVPGRAWRDPRASP